MRAGTLPQGLGMGLDEDEAPKWQYVVAGCDADKVGLLSPSLHGARLDATSID